MRFMDLCVHLFNMVDDPEQGRDNEQCYFGLNKREHFFDLLDQLKNASDSKKKDDFEKWLTKKNFITKDDARKKQDFEAWLEKMKLKPNKNDKKEKFYRWNWKTVIQDNEVFDKFTHKQIYEELLEAEKLGFIDESSLLELLHFREVTFDIYMLLDKDNDKKLRSLELDSKGGELVASGLLELWEFLEKSSVKGKYEFGQWIERKKNKYQVEIEYHEFQKMLWEGKILHEIDVEQLQA